MECGTSRLRQRRCVIGGKFGKLLPKSGVRRRVDLDVIERDQAVLIAELDAACLLLVPTLRIPDLTRSIAYSTAPVKSFSKWLVTEIEVNAVFLPCAIGRVIFNWN